jgi:hypothetical protein
MIMTRSTASIRRAASGYAFVSVPPKINAALTMCGTSVIAVTLDANVSNCEQFRQASTN